MFLHWRSPEKENIKVQHTQRAEHLGMLTPIKKRKCQTVLNVCWWNQYQFSVSASTQRRGRRDCLFCQPISLCLLKDLKLGFSYQALAFIYIYIYFSQAFYVFWALIFELLLRPAAAAAADGICASRDVARNSDGLCGIFSRLKCLYWMFQQLENHHGNGPKDKSPSLLSRVIIAEQSPQSLPFGSEQIHILIFALMHLTHLAFFFFFFVFKSGLNVDFKHPLKWFSVWIKWCRLFHY